MCRFVPVKKVTPDTNCQSIMSKYSVDIDFDIKQNQENTLYIIYVKVKINTNNDIGYSIVVEGAGVFERKDIEVKEFTNILLNSGVSICITNIRSYIANMTSYYPLGKYNFPSVDMLDLFTAKQAQNG